MVRIARRADLILFAALIMAGLLTGVSLAQAPAVPAKTPAKAPAATPKPAAPKSPAPVLQTPEGPDTVVLKVGDQPYTKADLDFIINNLSPQVQRSVATQGRKALGDQFATIVLLSQQAHSHHLDQTPAFEHKVVVQKQQLQAQAAYDEIVLQAKVTPDEISKYYSEHATEYDEIMVRQMVVRKRPPNATTGPGLAPEEAKTRAEAIRKEVVAGKDIKQVAADFKASVPADPKEDVIIQAEPQSVRRGGMRPEMDKAVFALKDGEVSEIFDVPQAMVMMQVTAHKRAELKDVSPQIEQALQKQKIDAAMGDLKKQTTIWMDDQYFAAPAGLQPSPEAVAPTLKPAEKP